MTNLLDGLDALPTGDVPPLDPDDDGNRCKHPGCTKEARSKGWCSMHYSRQRDGRPMDDPPGTRTRGPSAGGAPRQRSAKARLSLSELRDGLMVILSAGNDLMLRYVLPEAYRDDALNAPEIVLLSDALAIEAERSKRIAKLLERVGGVSSHAELIKAAYIIALPRLARHGVFGTPSNSQPAAFPASSPNGIADEVSVFTR